MNQISYILKSIMKFLCDKKLKFYFSSISILLIFSLFSSGCTVIGSSIAGGGVVGGGGAPTVSIPAPVVTRITVSSPEGGVSVVRGAPGAVVGRNLVTVKNRTKRNEPQSILEKLFLNSAIAATLEQTLAKTDGSFSVNIDATVGDVISIDQTDLLGNVSSAVLISVPYQPLGLNFSPVDIVSDPVDGSSIAYVVGTNNNSTQFIPVNFGIPATLGSFSTLSSEFCSSPIAATAYQGMGLFAELLIIDNINQQICLQSTLGGNTTFIPNPSSSTRYLNTQMDFATSNAIITTNNPVNDAQIYTYSTGTTLLTPITLPNPGGTGVQTGTPSIATGFTDVSFDYAMVIVNYTNGQNYLFIICTSGSPPFLTTNGSILLPSVVSPRDMKAYDITTAPAGGKILLADGTGKAHILKVSNLGFSSTSVTVIKTLDVGSNPIGVDIDETNHIGYVVNQGSNTVSVIDLNSGVEAVTKTLNVGSGPTQVAFERTTDQIGVISSLDGSFVTILNP